MDTAFNNGHLECCDVILNNNLDISLHNAFYGTNNETVWDMILEHGVKHANNSLPGILVYITCDLVANESVLRYILQSRFREHLDLDFELDNTDTLISGALNRQEIEFIYTVLQYDVNVNKANRHGMTPLGISVSNTVHRRPNQPHIFKDFIKTRALLHYGCDTNVPWVKWPYSMPISASPCFAVQLAHRFARPELLEMLIIAGADVSVVEPYRRFYPVQETEDEILRKAKCQSIVDIALSQPKSMKCLARFCIRNSVGINLPRKLYELKGILPPVLLQYLFIPEMNSISEPQEQININ
jgi:hypothetical protein